MQTTEKNIEIEQILEPTEKETKLKNYFHRMENIYGEELTLATASVQEEEKGTTLTIRDSIALYGADVADLDDVDVEVAIIRNALVSSEKNPFIDYVKTKVRNGQVDELTEYLESSETLKTALLKEFIKGSYSTMESRYHHLAKQEKVLEDLRTLDYYEKRAKLEKNHTKAKRK